MEMTRTPPVAIRMINVKKHFKDRDVEALGGAFAAICAMVWEALGSGGGLEEESAIKE
jgi:hypothetical protein